MYSWAELLDLTPLGPFPQSLSFLFFLLLLLIETPYPPSFKALPRVQLLQEAFRQPIELALSSPAPNSPSLACSQGTFSSTAGVFLHLTGQAVWVAQPWLHPCCGVTHRGSSFKDAAVLGLGSCTSSFWLL